MKTFNCYAGTIPESIPVGSVAVTVYHDTRRYGGPEEGGWWYTEPTVTDVYLFRSLRKAKMFLRSRTFRQDYRAQIEYAGANPIGRDSDGMLCSNRPWNLRPVYRGRELLYRPHYC